MVAGGQHDLVPSLARGARTTGTNSGTCGEFARSIQTLIALLPAQLESARARGTRARSSSGRTARGSSTNRPRWKFDVARAGRACARPGARRCDLPARARRRRQCARRRARSRSPVHSRAHRSGSSARSAGFGRRRRQEELALPVVEAPLERRVQALDERRAAPERLEHVPRVEVVDPVAHRPRRIRPRAVRALRLDARCHCRRDALVERLVPERGGAHDDRACQQVRVVHELALLRHSTGRRVVLVARRACGRGETLRPPAQHHRTASPRGARGRRAARGRQTTSRSCSASPARSRRSGSGRRSDTPRPARLPSTTASETTRRANGARPRRPCRRRERPQAARSRKRRARAPCRSGQAGCEAAAGG